MPVFYNMRENPAFQKTANSCQGENYLIILSRWLYFLEMQQNEPNIRKLFSLK